MPPNDDPHYQSRLRVAHAEVAVVEALTRATTQLGLTEVEAAHVLVSLSARWSEQVLADERSATEVLAPAWVHAGFTYVIARINGKTQAIAHVGQAPAARDHVICRWAVQLFMKSRGEA